LTHDNIENKLNNSNILVRSENSPNELPSQVHSALFDRSKKSGLLESNFDSELYKLIGEGTMWLKIMSHGLATVPPQVSKLLARKEQLRLLRENVMLVVRDYNNIKHTIEDKEVPLFQEHLGRLDA
jgi:dynein heavy chain